MDTWSLLKALPISCNDCPAFQRHHIAVRWFTESFTRLRCVINTTFREKIYTRWCCIDRLSWQVFSEGGFDGRNAIYRRPSAPNNIREASSANARDACSVQTPRV